MKKILFIALAIVAMASLGAMAQTVGDPLPAGAVNPGTWEWNGTTWVHTQYAKTWNSNSESSGGMTNKESISFEIINHVSVAQWIEWTISGTRKDWRVLRPGTYASDSVTATIKSNNDVLVSFWAEDPEYMVENAGVTRTIPKFFSFSEGDDANDAEANGWVAASETSPDNPYQFIISDSAGLHAGLAYKIWEKIEVVPSNSSSEYEGRGMVTVSLTNIKHWVDPETGTWLNPGTSSSTGGYGYLDGV